MSGQRVKRSTPEIIERNRQWARRFAAGETLQSIADEIGVTREAIRQGLITHGLYEEAASTRRRRAGQKRRWEEQRRAQRERDRQMAVRRKSPEVRAKLTQYTNDDILLLLRGWMAAGGSGKSTDWVFSPSKSTIENRFGSWHMAMRLAGFPPSNPRGPYRRRFQPEDCIAAVVAFMCDDSAPNKSAASYDKWARLHHLRPSLSLVRMRVGMWADAKEEALRVLREEA